ncbi:MAG: hypothetical protein M1273_08315 [Deltaproteobacteria bacterium]|jgi:hypothetical protein|nr:hypothetical protein [Deltaproteobacteria bacterium]
MTYTKILTIIISIFIGALLTGFATLLRDIYIKRKDRLSTAHAFKGEINSILDIMETRKYMGSLQDMIDRKKQIFEELKNVYKSPDSLKSLSVIYAITPLLSFSFLINEDVFFVKNKLGDKIGLLDNAAEKVISFYGYANSFLLDIENNIKTNDEYEKLINNDNGLEKNIKDLEDFYKIHNIPYMAENNIIYHENMLKIVNEIIEAGKKSITELDKLISKL